jgi:hypothetical protein
MAADFFGRHREPSPGTKHGDRLDKAGYREKGMTYENTTENPSLSKHIDTFVSRFFVAGARDYVRKTTYDAPWINMGIMEKTNPQMFYGGKLFEGANIVCGPSYSLGHGLIHGYLREQAEEHVRRAVNKLNALPAREIVFYHDESEHGLDLARKMGLEFNFTPVSLLQWLLRRVNEAGACVGCDLDVAVQLPCSWKYGPERDSLLDELLERMGVRRVARHYDRGRRICCAARGYFGLMGGDVHEDTSISDALVKRNVADAREAGATHLITLCPACYFSLAPAARRAGLVPMQVEGLTSLHLYGEMPPGGQELL